MKRFFTFLLASILSSGLFAQEVVQQIVNEATGTPSFVKFSTQNAALTLDKAPALLRSQLNAAPAEEFVRYRKEVDPILGQLERYQQYYNGVKVENGQYFVHANNGKIVSINGHYRRIENLSTTPAIAEELALEKALDFIGAENYMWQSAANEEFAKKTEAKGTYFPHAEMVIVEYTNAKNRDEVNQPRLAYKFDIYAEKPLSRDFVYIDAQTGEVLGMNPIIKHAREHNHEHAHTNHGTKSEENFSFLEAATIGNAATRYSGNRNIETEYYNGTYRLKDLTRGSGVQTFNMKEGTNYTSAVDFTDADNNWIEYNNTAKDNAALDAHWGAMVTYDYWKNTFNRNSFDGNGTAIKSYVHYSKDYDNAYWNGSVMTYGDGSDVYFDALTSLDVCAHEIGHAICTYTADLAYQNESGAMNEGFSDIWAAVIENFGAPEKGIWLIGEDIERRTGHLALRSMSDPNSEGQPDTYFGTNWAALASSPSSTNDYGGVHTNSGVMNFWFYVLAVGKSGTNDLGNAYSVTGIGIEKAANIAYRLESVYLSSSSTFANARDFSIQAATDLYGSTSAEVVAVTNAWYAVGVGSAYGTISYCASKGSNSSYEWIAGVTIGSFTNTSAAAGYTDFTSKTVNLSAGQSYAVSLSPGFQSSAYNEYWKIWIDLNADGDFTDASEQVFDGGALINTTETGTLVVPSVAAIITRMRVSMKYNAAQTSACETFSYGEVEDYTVVITAGGGDVTAPSAPTNLAASSISQTSLSLSWTAATDNVGVTGYDVYRNSTLIGSVTGTSTQVTGLTAATSYSFSVKAKDAAGNVSAASSTINATTLSAADVTAPSAPASLTASATTQTTVNLSWTASTDNVGVTGYDVYRNSTLLSSVTGTSTLVTGLTASTSYSFYVKAKDAAGNVSAASNTVNVTTLAASTGGPMPTGYCASKGSNATYEWIDLVQLGSINNVTSKNNGYADFTTKSTNLALGSTNTIYFSAGFKSTAYTEYWAIFIDYNRDGDFLDAGEKVVSGSSSSSATLSGTFTVPATASLGTTRMRVSMKYNAAQTACETFSYGEVEDYAVVIGSTSFALSGEGENIFAEKLGVEESKAMNVYPNPFSDELMVDFNFETKEVNYQIINMQGAVVLKDVMNTTSGRINTSDLPNGLYLIRFFDGQKTMETKIAKH